MEGIQPGELASAVQPGKGDRREEAQNALPTHDAPARLSLSSINRT